MKRYFVKFRKYIHIFQHEIKKKRLIECIENLLSRSLVVAQQHVERLM